MKTNYRILFLHRSTGEVIYNEGGHSVRFISRFIKPKSFVSKWFDNYNKLNNTNYKFEEQSCPKSNSYG